ncbi:tetratricopeptide repeat protein [Actinocorallia lasiicapitis]
MSVLVDPMAGWLGGLLGDAWVGLLRGSPDERAVKQAMGKAVGEVLASITDDVERGRVRAGLRVCFAHPPLPQPDTGLRDAVITQVRLLREMSDGAALFYDTVTVDADWLEAHVADAFAEAVTRVVAASSLAESVGQLRHEVLLADLAELRTLLSAAVGPRRESGRAVVGALLVGVIPLAADCFQNREAAARLERVLSGGDTAILTNTSGCGSGVLSGTGGVGKTQLAAAHARRFLADGADPVVVWVTATDGQAIIDAYAQAAVSLDLPGRAGDDRLADARLLLSWTVTTRRQWLIVLDDIQDPEDVAAWWPPADASGRVLATTRRRDSTLIGAGRRLVPIDVFTPAEARTYLTERLTSDHYTPDPAAAPAPDPDPAGGELEGLAADLGWLPLALAQAAAYLIDAGITVLAYRALLADRTRTLAELAPDSLPDNHPAIVAATWSLSIDRATTLRPVGMARPLLELLSVLDPNGIPQTVLTSPPALTHLNTNDPAQVIAALRLLHRFTLITHNPTALHQEIRIHQLIQRATREHPTPTTTPATTALAAADALHAVWPAIERDHLGQALRANTTTLHSTTGATLYGPATGAHPVLFRAATSLGDTGQVTAAITAYATLHASCRTHLGPDHSHTLTSRGNLARWRGEAGDPAGAAAAFEDLLVNDLRILGPDHPHTLATRHNLAYWRGEAGDPAGAAAAFEELLADCLRGLGPDHPDTLTTRQNLAYWRGQAGDPAGAVAAFEELLADYLRVLGPDHPHALTSRGNLARWRGEAGDPAGAVAAFEELLADRLRVLGPDHPHTLATRNHLAYWRGEAGDPAGAVAAFEELLADRLRVLGPDHPYTLTSRNHLAYFRGRAEDL